MVNHETVPIHKDEQLAAALEILRDCDIQTLSSVHGIVKILRPGTDAADAARMFDYNFGAFGMIISPNNCCFGERGDRSMRVEIETSLVRIQRRSIMLLPFSFDRKPRTEDAWLGYYRASIVRG